MNKKELSAKKASKVRIDVMKEIRKTSDKIKKNAKTLNKFSGTACDFIVPEYDTQYKTNLSKRYPLGIKPGYYTHEELAEAIHFLADMMEQ